MKVLELVCRVERLKQKPDWYHRDAPGVFILVLLFCCFSGFFGLPVQMEAEVAKAMLICVGKLVCVEECLKEVA